MKLVSKASPGVAAAAAAASGLPPGSTAVLIIQPGFAPQSGVPNPVGNHGFYLLKDSIEAAFAKGGFRVPAGTQPVTAMNLACAKKTPDCQLAVAAIIGDSATAVKTDGEGKATLPAVPPGIYYLFGVGQFEGKQLVWDVKVQIKAGANSITLDQHNGTVLQK